MGELHLEVYVDKKREYKVEVETSPPRVSVVKPSPSVTLVTPTRSKLIFNNMVVAG